MAIARLSGTQHFEASASPLSITIPAGTNCIVIFDACYSSNSAAITAASIGTENFTLDAGYATGDASHAQCRIGHLITSTTGAQSLAVTYGNIEYSHSIIVAYYSGVAESLRDSDAASGGTITLTTTSGDTVVVGCASADSFTSWSANVTSFDNYSNAQGIIGNIADGTADSTSEAITATASYHSVGGIVLIAEGGGEPSSAWVPFRRLNILLRLCLSTFNLIWRCFK